MTYLSDRQRRELAVLPRILWSVCRQDGALVEERPGEVAALHAALDAVNAEIFTGLSKRDADKAERQILRATAAVIQRAGIDGQPSIKIIAAIWIVLDHLINTGALIIWAETPMARVVEALGPAQAEIRNTPALAHSAAKAARRLFAALREEGLWTSVPPIATVEKPR